MAATIHILGFAGSLRKNSYNRAALKVAQSLVPEGAEMEIITLDEIPLYNQDYEDDEPSSVRTFKEKIRQADALFIVTPEYNYSMPGVLKNAIDWASRPAAMSRSAQPGWPATAGTPDDRPEGRGAQGRGDCPDRRGAEGQGRAAGRAAGRQGGEPRVAA